MTSEWARWRLKSPASRLFTQPFIQLQIRVTGLFEENSPVTGEFPTQRTSYAENVSIWWRHHNNDMLRVCSSCSKHVYNHTLFRDILYSCFSLALRWRHNERDGVSNHQPHDCLLKRLFRHRSRKTSKLRVTGLCEGNSPVIGGFPAQMASNAENISIWWRDHGDLFGNCVSEMDHHWFTQLPTAS